MTLLWNKLKSDNRPIVLYGMGDGADKMIAQLNSIGKTPAAVFASDEFVRGQDFRGMRVLKFSEAKALYPDMLVAICFGTQRKEVLDNIKRIASEVEVITPDLPVIDGGVFDIDFCKANIDNLEFIYNNLADDISRHTFESIIRLKLSGDINYLFNCEVNPLEPYGTILNLSDSETYVDLGAYRGDTVSEFLSQTNAFDKIYAVEPDIKNFAKLFDAYGKIANCINAAASDRVGETVFSIERGRSSHISSSGKTVATVTVDSILEDGPATFIKLDVEGNEIAAINGAKRTIENFKPKLCVAAYHRFDDIIKIPMHILNMRPDYKMYLRHFPYIPSWDTNYYFV